MVRVLLKNIPTSSCDQSGLVTNTVQYIKMDLVYPELYQRKGVRNNMVGNRDGNSSKNFIPRGIEESRNSKIAFLGDRGI